jgi:hypothetical protein
MAQMSMNELKLAIAEILDEAKKKRSQADKHRRRGAAVEAYGLYDEAFDFSEPLGALNLYRQQGAANWGPSTSDGPHIDSKYYNPNTAGGMRMREGDERALRALVREVIENGLVPAGSAWAPLMERSSREPTSAWDAAGPLFEAWYDKFKKSGEAASKASSKSSGKASSKAGHEHTSYGSVGKHGQDKKKPFGKK